MSDELNQELKAWANALSRALSNWLYENGYRPNSRARPLNALAKELNLTDSTFTKIRTGTMVSNDAGVYARIFAYTGLTEADPRLLPDREIVHPKDASKTVTVSRKWTEEQWQKFLTEQRQSGSFVNEPSEPTAAKNPEPVESMINAKPEDINKSITPQYESVNLLPSTSTFGGWIDQGISMLAKQIVSELNIPEIVQQVVDNTSAQKVSQPESIPASVSPLSELTFADIGRLSDMLYSLFQQMMQGDKEDRDKIADMFGDRLARIYPYINALTEGKPEDRERRLHSIVEIDF